MSDTNNNEAIPYEEYMKYYMERMEHPELYDKREPGLKIGDVVESFTRKYKLDDDDLYFVKEVTLVYDGIHPSKYVYEIENTQCPQRTFKIEESDLIYNYHDPKWAAYVESIKERNQEELQLKLECIKNNLNENGIVLTEGEDLLDYSYYYEMAGRIPGELKVGKKGILIVAMGANEDRGEAHFHIFRSKNDWKAWKNGACLLFKENKYFDHADNRETLTRGEMETLVQCLKSKPKQNLPGDTYWQYLIYLWNGNNYDFKIDLNTPMPDYSYDTITRYKEK